MTRYDRLDLACSPRFAHFRPMVSAVRTQTVVLSLSILALSAVSPIEAQTVCGCSCFPVPGGQVCQRHCYLAEPFVPEATEDDPPDTYEDATDEVYDPQSDGEEQAPTGSFADNESLGEAADDPFLRDDPSRDGASAVENAEPAPALHQPQPVPDDRPDDGKSLPSLAPETRDLIREVIITGVSALAGAGALRLLSRLSAIARIRRDITVIGRHTGTVRNVEKKLRDAAREADVLIERYRRQFYRRGYQQ